MHRTRSLRKLALGLTLSLSHFAFPLGTSAAPDWPEFRGPTGDGHSPARNVPLRWSATDNIAWKVPVPGRGWSSPVLVGQRLYLTSAIPKSDADTIDLAVLCLDAATGKLVWNTTVFGQGGDAPAPHRKNSHASPTPLVRGDRIFVHFGHMGTAALDLDGKVVWRNATLKYNPVHGNGGTPILVGDDLVFSCDGGSDPFVVALRSSDGSVHWKVDRKSTFPRTFSFATASFVEAAGRRQIISPASGFVASYDPADGRELWRARYGGWSVIAKPVFAHGLTFISTGYEAPTVIAVRLDGSGDVSDTHVAWTLRRGAPNTPSFLVLGDELYLLADNGVFSCVDARTGVAHYQERACGQSSASPVFVEGRIYLLDEQGLGVVLAPGKEFKKLAENPLGERTLASYAVTDGALFVRSEENLFRIGAKP
ncbi:MAG: PQQ-binding-like beta-propeller repeat protein [Verrucomicrobiales bacterium]|nr:PQQ-binding-like beta-propeller repeat protein [Verrucomicrobiales bacterium]